MSALNDIFEFFHFNSFIGAHHIIKNEKYCKEVLVTVALVGVTHNLYVSGYGFRHFDYGTWNYWTYKTLKPPEYNIDRITTPIYLYYAENDLVLSPKVRCRDVYYTENYLKSSNLDKLPRTECGVPYPVF